MWVLSSVAHDPRGEGGSSPTPGTILRAVRSIPFTPWFGFNCGQVSFCELRPKLDYLFRWNSDHVPWGRTLLDVFPRNIPADPGRDAPAAFVCNRYVAVLLIIWIELRKERFEGRQRGIAIHISHSMHDSKCHSRPRNDLYVNYGFKNPWPARGVRVSSSIADDRGGEGGSSPSPGTLPAPALDIAGIGIPFLLDIY